MLITHVLHLIMEAHVDVLLLKCTDVGRRYLSNAALSNTASFVYVVLDK